MEYENNYNDLRYEILQDNYKDPIRFREIFEKVFNSNNMKVDSVNFPISTQPITLLDKIDIESLINDIEQKIDELSLNPDYNYYLTCLNILFQLEKRVVPPLPNQLKIFELEKKIIDNFMIYTEELLKEETSLL